METITRVLVLAGACALLWIVEGRRPLFAFGPERTRHVGPNVVLAALTLATNLGLAWVVRPVGPGPYPWPFWLHGRGRGGRARPVRLAGSRRAPQDCVGMADPPGASLRRRRRRDHGAPPA